LQVYIPVDVTDVNQPFVNGSLAEGYSEYRGNQHDPSRAKISDVDLEWLVTAARALYGNDQFGNQRAFVPFCNCDPNNLMRPDCGVVGGWNKLNIRYFVKPFAWADGDEAAAVYGGSREEHLFSVQLGELAPATVPMDGNQVTSGTFLYPSPLTMLATVDRNASAHPPRVDPRNTLPGSTAVGLTFYGRGLSFDAAAISALVAAKAAGDEKTVADIFGAAIHRAWADESVHGVQPGVLAVRATDGALVPAIVLEHPLREASCAPHPGPRLLPAAP
jgi:hypothetical protein